MDALSTIAEIFRDLFIVVGVLTALLVVIILVIARMRADNPLKRLLRALSYRMGATIVAGVLAIPIEPIPGLDVLYDLGAPLLLLIYWLSFFKNAGRMVSGPSPRTVPSMTIDRVPPQRSGAKDIIDVLLAFSVLPPQAPDKRLLAEK